MNLIWFVCSLQIQKKKKEIAHVARFYKITDKNRIHFYCWWRIIQCNKRRRYRESEEHSWKWCFAWCLLWRIQNDIVERCGKGTPTHLFIRFKNANKWLSYVHVEWSFEFGQLFDWEECQHSSRELLWRYASLDCFTRMSCTSLNSI